MLFALDVGNTRIKMALVGDESGHRAAEGRMPTERGWTVEQYRAAFVTFFQQSGHSEGIVDAVAVSSVVPALNAILLEAISGIARCTPFVVGPETDVGIGVRYQSRASVGADRLCNAVGAFARYGGPAIVVDYGTATKFDVVAANGDFLGGAILPGIAICVEALYDHAPHLPRVPFIAPPGVIGHNTLHALQSGIVYGFAAQTDAMVLRIQQEMETPAAVIATGGFASSMHLVSKTIGAVDVDLTLEGLRLLWWRNNRACH